MAIGPAPAIGPGLQEVLDWRPELVVTLIGEDEGRTLGFGRVVERLRLAGSQVLAAPIRDMTAPDAAFTRHWPALRADLLGRLESGGRVLVHCRAGYGRSGTVAAGLLIGAGATPEEAIRLVRRSRPGAIETPGQEAWLRALAGT